MAGEGRKKFPSQLRLAFSALALVSLLAGCAARGTPLVSVAEVTRNPEAFRDRPVRLRGHGTMVATFPLCPGYVGLDRRTVFVDAEGGRITAEVRWTPPPNFRMYDPDGLRTFTGYIRIFSGEIGCPGSVQVETFPYVEITGVEESP
ncbi:MAG: hypothetical protein ACP5UM_10070 [Anaerolineae bacterium]